MHIDFERFTPKRFELLALVPLSTFKRHTKNLMNVKNLSKKYKNSYQKTEMVTYINTDLSIRSLILTAVHRPCTKFIIIQMTHIKRVLVF